MRKLTLTILMLSMLVLLFTSILVDSDRLAWRLCGAAIGGAAGSFIGASLLDSAKACRHPNLYEKKWRTEEGAPMIRQWCPDCNFLRYEEIKP